MEENQDPSWFGITGGGASNCWAVHGNYTTGGKPILACDPHFLKSTQSSFYSARISWKKGDQKVYIAGGSTTGIPGFYYGRSDYVSWGTTSINADVIDLYTETIKDG
jgi:penicillin G amidase